MPKDTTPAIKAAEILAFSLAVAVVNWWFFPENVGFLAGFFNPYTTLCLFIAVYYGKYYGFLSLGASALAVSLGIPVARGLLSGAGPAIPAAHWAALGERAPLPLAIALVEAYILGMMRSSLTKRDRGARARLTSISRDKGLLRRQVRALESANRELEERVSRQENSITSLYSQVEVLHSLNLSKAFQAILEMVRRFVGATRCSIWEHRPESGSLALAAAIGWREVETARATLPDESSIEGWVVRNNMMFSVKMVRDNKALAKMDTGRNIMTLPIPAGRRIWGVLNIEEMPFAKYNLYSERLLLVIMALAGSALERAIEYESVVHQEDINPVTGLPSFSQFYALLEKELERLAVTNGTVAVIVTEVSNFGDLAEQHGKERAFALMSDLARTAQEVSGGQGRIFHYKSDPQLVILYPNLDSDGASLFSLNLLGKVNAGTWQIGDARVFLEVILGFAARAGGGQKPEELMEAAENLLDMQKV